MLIVMFPGMITGSSTASVLTTGTMAGSILVGLGLSRERAAAVVAMGGVLGMIAPPINIPAMIIGTGIDLPYVGFGAPLALASFPLALALVYALGWPVLGRKDAAREVDRGAPPAGLAGARVAPGGGHRHGRAAGVAAGSPRPGPPADVCHRGGCLRAAVAAVPGVAGAAPRHRRGAARPRHPGRRRRVHPGDDVHRRARLARGADVRRAAVGDRRRGRRRHPAVRRRLGVRIGVGPRRPVPARDARDGTRW